MASLDPEQAPGWLYCSGGDGVQPVNSFALVTYIPDPLGSFLDDLRRELVPGCMPHAHVTILPPRPLSLDPQLAWKQVQSKVCDLPAFEIETADVEIFDVTSVIYISLGKGRQELLRMHDALNSGDLAFPEPFRYHPHITLAQELPPDRVLDVYDLARRRWAEFPHKRAFPVEFLTFVQNTLQNQWLDLAQCALIAVPSLG